MYEELGRFSGFLMPDQVRACVLKALTPEIEAKSPIPMRRANAPLVVAFCAVIENKKCVKQAVALIGPMCDFILANGVQNDALVACLRAIKGFAMACEAEQALKILQFVATLLPTQYADVGVLRLIFSLALSLCTHPVGIVCTTAFATSQQMISLFFNDVQTADVKMVESGVRSLKKLCGCEFEKPLCGVAYLLLSDICCMILGKPMVWLEFPSLPVSTLFRLWELIISSHQEFLCSNAKMLDILESSVVMPMIHHDELAFLVTFISKYMNALPATSMAVFSYFLGVCNVNSPSYASSLSFFRSAFFVYPEFGRMFYETCNPEGSLIQALLESFDEILKEKLHSLISVTLASVRDPNEFFDQGPGNSAREAAPIEVTIQIINSLAVSAKETMKVSMRKSSFNNEGDFSSAEKKDDESETKIQHDREKSSESLTSPLRATAPPDLFVFKRNRSVGGRRSSTVANVRSYVSDLTYAQSQYQTLVELIWPKLVSIIVRGIRYADSSSIDLMFETLNNLIMVMISSNIGEGRTMTLRLLCGIVSKQRIVREDSTDLEVLLNDLLHKNKKGLLFKAKRARASKLLLDLLYLNPLMFNQLYYRLFMTLSSYPKVDIKPDFTLNVSLGELCQICASLVKGNAFCLNFLSKILLINLNRFEPLFKTIELPLMGQLEQAETCDAAISLVVTASTATPSSVNDDIFVPIIGSLLERHDLSAKNRLTLLNQMKYVTLKKSGEIVRGWSFILRSITLTGVPIDVEIVPVSFSILNTICNSYVKKMTQENMRLVVDRVFEFAFQTIDMNISLSSFDLLWMIVSHFRHDIEYWKVMLMQTLVLSEDHRGDVAVCALRTFFSLIDSSIAYLPHELFYFLICECFVPQLRKCDSQPWNIQELLLQEACECSFSFWDHFQTVAEFVQVFWPLLIEKQEQFMIHCDDPEVVVEGLRFYDVSLCNKLPTETRASLTVSFTKVVKHSVDNEPPTSLILSSLGRYVVKIIAAQKAYVATESLGIWLDMVVHMCTKMPSHEFINLSAKKGVLGIMALVPFDTGELNQQVLRAWIDLVDTCGIACVREEIVATIWEMFPHSANKLDFFIQCRKLFKFPEAKPLAEHLLEEDVHADNKDALFACYNTIAINYRDLASMAETKLTLMLPAVSNAVRLEYIQSKASNQRKLHEIWALYCAPDSPDFNLYVYQGCFAQIVTELKHLIIRYADDDPNQLISILAFLQAVTAPPKKTTSSGQPISFLVDFLPELVTLVDHPELEIQRKATELLQHIHTNIYTLLSLR